MNNKIEVHYIVWYLLYRESQCRHRYMSSLLQPTWEIADSKCKRYFKNIGRVYPLKMVSFYANWSRFANITLLRAQIVRKKKSVRPLSHNPINVLKAMSLKKFELSLNIFCASCDESDFCQRAQTEH